MNTSTGTDTFADTLGDLMTRAVRQDVPVHVARRARDATARALNVNLAATATSRLTRRAEAYFSACVRRETVRGGAGPRAAARLVAAAVVKDMLEAGRDGSAAWQELEQGWSDLLPEDMLEEYRLRLCG